MHDAPLAFRAGFQATFLKHLQHGRVPRQDFSSKFLKSARSCVGSAPLIPVAGRSQGILPFIRSINARLFAFYTLSSIL